jgi:lipid-binding SYLF domain-containing protein
MKALLALGLMIALLAIVAATQVSEAGSATEINVAANATLQSFVGQNSSARELGHKAAGVLVFPSILKAGLGFGGEYGEGVFIVKGNATGYYNIVSASFGFQLGVQSRSLIIMFMTEEALAGFQKTSGWKAGVDGSIVVVTVGAGESIDTNTLTSPIIAFVIDPQGLMYNLSLEG